jgi:hypothetical protein
MKSRGSPLSSVLVEGLPSIFVGKGSFTSAFLSAAMIADEDCEWNEGNDDEGKGSFNCDSSGKREPDDEVVAMAISGSLDSEQVITVP